MSTAGYPMSAHTVQLDDFGRGGRRKDWVDCDDVRASESQLKV